MKIVKLKSIAYTIYNIHNLYVAWVIYIVALRYFDKEKMPLDAWQFKDIFIIFQKREVCLNRARGGSKTRDMALLCLFFTLRGNEVKWFAPTRTQLNQAKKYWHRNPFANSFNWRNKQLDIITTINNFSFDIAITTTTHTKGGRANIIFFDEMALMSRSTLGDIMPVTNGMDLVGDGIFLLFFSTPLINTVFEEYTFMYPTLTHDWEEPSWFNRLRMLRIKATISPSKWKTEYCCIFAAMDGQVFEENLVNAPYSGALRPTVFIGSDPNPREGYAAVSAQYSVNLARGQAHIVITKARNFGPNNSGKNAMFAYLRKELHNQHTEAEFEDNGVGKVVWDDYDELDPRPLGDVNRVDWGTSGVGDKVARANAMNGFIIHIWYDNPALTPSEKKYMKNLWSQMNAVAWTKDGKKIDKPADQAWHLSDSCMHACAFGESGGMSAYAA